MRRFNFLRPSLTEALDALHSIDVPAPLRRSIVGLCACVAVVIAAAAVERAREDAAESAAARAATRLAIVERDVASMQDALATIARLGLIAKQVRAARSSGYLFAERIVAIGASLSPELWLDSLNDTDGVVLLSGKSEDYDSISRAIRDLHKVHAIADQSLISAQIVDATALVPLVSYQLQLTERAP